MSAPVAEANRWLDAIADYACTYAAGCAFTTEADGPSVEKWDHARRVLHRVVRMIPAWCRELAKASLGPKPTPGAHDALWEFMMAESVVREILGLAPEQQPQQENDDGQDEQEAADGDPGHGAAESS